MKMNNGNKSDYVGEFLGNLGSKLTSYIIPVIITLIGAFATSFLGDISIMNFSQKIVALVILFSSILIIFAIFFMFKELFNYIIYNNKKNGIQFPYNISIDDISPYTIEEEKTEKKYLYTEDNKKFDVINTITYKVKGGCSKVEFIEHTFSGFHLNNSDDLSISLASISGKKIIEASPVKSQNQKSCVVRAEFETALFPNESSSYQIILNYKNYQDVYKNDYNNQVIHSKRADLEIKRLILSIEFPEKYLVLQPEYIVESKSNVRIDRVEDLCSVENLDFTEQINQNPIKLELVVEKPIPSLKYMLSWKLPNLLHLEKSNFLNINKN